MASSHRARRWDVLVMGSALPGLVAAIRLAMGGHRVLVVEEEAAVRIPEFLREPFALPGPASNGVLDPWLRALGLPPIDRRAFATDPLSHQVLAPRLRLDVGASRATAEEWIAWGLAKSEEAGELARELEAAARAEVDALLEAPLIRPARRSLALRRTPRRTGLPERLGTTAARGVTASGATSSGARRHARGLPQAVAAVGPALGRVFEAQVRAFSNLATADPPPEAKARLLGAPLTGGSAFHRNDKGLRSLLRRRLEALHGEFRTLGGPFAFVALGDQPGILRVGPDDAWLGRALLVNAPAGRLAAALEADGREVPDFLAGPRPTHRRLTIHLRAVAEVVPEGLARRAVLLPEAGTPGRTAVSLSLHPSPRGSRFTELAARTVVPDGPAAFDDAAARVERTLLALMPFAAGRMARAPLAPLPQWDDEGALADPDPQDAWPGEVSIRAAGRRPVYVLRREAVGALGIEGELLFGWRAGDAIREELG